MKRKKNFILIIFISVISIIIIRVFNTEWSEYWLFPQYFVEPFTSLILGTAHFFHDNYGIAIILVTLLVRIILLPLMLKQYKTQANMKEKMDLIKT